MMPTTMAQNGKCFLKILASVIIILALNQLFLFHYAFDKSGRLIARKRGPHSTFHFNHTTNVYEMDGKPILWQFWPTDRPPIYVRLLVEAMQCRNPEFKSILVSLGTVYEYLPELESVKRGFNRLTIKNKSDVFRVGILRQYGGVYVDVNAFPLDKIYPLFGLLSTYDLINAEWDPYNRFSHGPTGPSAYGPTILQLWYAEIMRKLKKLTAFYHPKNKRGDQRRLARFGIKIREQMEMEKEITSNRTRYMGYVASMTIGQLLSHLVNDSARDVWMDESAEFLPLHWAPFLLVNLGESLSKMASIGDLMKGETVFSVFVGCALIDCWDQYAEMEKRNVVKTELGRLNLSALMQELKKINLKTCESVRKDLKFDFDQYRV